MFTSHGRADDIDDGVDGADLVELDLLDGHGMDIGFGFAQELESSAGASLYRFRQRGSRNDAEDCGERAMRLV